MFGWIVGSIVFLALCGFIFEINNKKKSFNELEKLKKSFAISLSVYTIYGYIAFSDLNKKVYLYRPTTNMRDEFEYNKITSAGVSFSENSLLVLINIANPKDKQYEFASVNQENKRIILNKLENIINNNLIQAKAEYEKIIPIPNTASLVKVFDYKGVNNDIPCGVNMGTQNTYLWRENQKLCLMSKFGSLFDFRVRRNAYNPTIIDIKNIVELSQSGNVHYSTTISGGGGGGTSIKGAIVGGLIAGEVGAIIGSRKSTEPITSSTSQIDDRRTYMKILDDNNNFFEIVFDYNDYYMIKKLLEI